MNAPVFPIALMALMAMVLVYVRTLVLVFLAQVVVTGRVIQRLGYAPVWHPGFTAITVSILG